MSYVGKRLRLGRLTSGRGGSGIIVPIDHGLTLGPLRGLESLAGFRRWITHPAVTGIIAHKGVVERLGSLDLLGRLAVVVHVNGMSTLSSKPDHKERLTGVEAAVRLGADAVSIQANFDGDNDAQNLVSLGRLVDEAQALSIPVLAMVYDKVPCEDRSVACRRMRHLLRICIELGADAVKIGAPERPADLAELLYGVVEHTTVFVAGGALCEDAGVLALARAARGSGAHGLCMGRNVFQRDDPGPLLSAVSSVLASPGGRAALQPENAAPGAELEGTSQDVLLG